MTLSPRAARALRVTPARRALLTATLSNTLSVVPLFLLGALATLLRADLGFGETQLGLAAASFSAAATVVAVPGGRLGERIGVRRAIVLGGVVSAVALLSIAALARSWGVLCALLVLAGVGNGLAQPATNGVLAQAVPGGRQGLAFGVKQASVPLAGFVAGLALPLVAVPFGWRWAFAGAALAVVPVVVGAEVGRDRGRATRRRGGGALRTGDAALPSLVMLAVGAGVGAAAANSLGAFYVESAVSTGLGEGLAGYALAGGGAAGVCARVAWGAVADRRDGPLLPRVSALMALGAVGFALLALGPAGIVLAAATVLGYAAGWGWPGLFNFAVVRNNPNAPTAATGITQTGVFAGAFIGPPAFGALVEAAGYPTAWLAGAGALLAGAGLMLVGRRRLVRDKVRRGV